MRDPAWLASGDRLVYRIMIRRRLKCQRAKTHQNNYPARCKVCGVAS